MKRELLLTSLNSLQQSTNKDWYSGDVNTWAAYAKQMRSAIENIAPLIRIIAENLEDKPTEKQNEN